MAAALHSVADMTANAPSATGNSIDALELPFATGTRVHSIEDDSGFVVMPPPQSAMHAPCWAPASRLAKHHCLLALDGARLTPELLCAAEACCIRMADRVDILLVNPPLMPIALLHTLLIRFEQAGIDYRLTSTVGEVRDQITRHLRRFLGIKQVLVTSFSALNHGPDMGRADLSGAAAARV